MTNQDQALQIRIEQWLNTLGLADIPLIEVALALVLILTVSLIVHFLLHRIVVRFIERSQKKDRKHWRQTFFGFKLFRRAALALQGAIVYILAGSLLGHDSALMPVIETVSHLWVILFTLLAFFSLLDGFEAVLKGSRSSSRLPLRGLFQSVKLAGTTIALILAVALLIDRSPIVLFSGLGAMTAVVLLIFREPILGLVAGIQLAANDMLSVDDWLEMPDYGADGDVIDISLTTVKVQNWDKTITSIPSYALISQSFKNWRNIEKVGGRRIKRSIHIDTTSVGFASEEDLDRLHKGKLLAEYISDKTAEINRDNQDVDSPMDRRALTNIGLLRAYLMAYLQQHPSLNHNLTTMVRQLEAGPHGIPLQLYGFAKETKWVPYENIQSEIFDHVYAIVPEFGLRLYQAPSGHDLKDLASAVTEKASSPDAAEPIQKEQA